MFKLRISLHGTELKTLELRAGEQYTFGRAPTCTFALGDHPGISRQHFRILDENGTWVVQVVAKFGDLFHAGKKVANFKLSSGIAFELPPYDFRVIEETENVGIESESKNLPVMSHGGNNYPSRYDGGAAAPDLHGFSGDDEHTFVGEVALLPYVRIVGGKGSLDEVIPLRGGPWIAGRDEACDIFLNEAKASRKQFEISVVGKGYFIKDLGSSNGTSVNGQSISKDSPTSLKSGDIITVQSLAIHFEVRDPNFENKLTVIPQQLLNAPAVLTPYGLDNYPVATDGRGGAIRLGESSGDLVLFDPKTWDPRAIDYKKPRNRVMLIGIGLLILLLTLIFSGTTSTRPNKDEKCGKFCTLTPEQKQFIKETYSLADNLFKQNKYRLAGDHFRKIHEVLPEGYQDSLQKQEDCNTAYNAEEMVTRIEEDRRREAELRRRVRAEVDRCRPIAAKTNRMEELEACLGEARLLNPNDEELNQLISEVRVRGEAAAARQMQQKEYASQVEKGRALFQRAQSLHNQKKYLEAMSAYQTHMNSSHPDPNALKNRSRQSLAAIRKMIDTDVDKYIDLAQRSYEQGAFKDALRAVDQAREIDPDNATATDLGVKVLRELSNQLQSIYSDSVIDENLGQLDQAKEKWKKIMEMDRPRGDYWVRARNKLRQYGVAQ